jgi:hypothetical protein
VESAIAEATAAPSSAMKAAAAPSAAIGESVAAITTAPATGVEVPSSLSSLRARCRLTVERRAGTGRSILPTAVVVLLPPGAGVGPAHISVVIGVHCVAVVPDSISRAGLVGKPAIHGARLAGIGIAVDALRSAMHHTRRWIVCGSGSAFRIIARVRIVVVASAAHTARGRA